MQEKMPTGYNIITIFNTCFAAIGGKKNADVVNYFNSRKQKITRAAFFKNVVWAVWVSGMGRKAARTFLNRAIISYDFTTYASMNRSQLNTFIRRVHYLGVTPWAEKKWLAIYNIALWLAKFATEKDFRQKVFNGKIDGEKLDKADVQRILFLNLPFIGWANSHYLVKNLGGQAIKCDRWVNELLFWGGLSQSELESRLNKAKIPLSLFDTVFWAYCEMFIGKTGDFKKHFSSKFGYLI